MVDELDKNMYKIIKIGEIDNYKCIFCDFYSGNLSSLTRHQNKKKSCYTVQEHKCIFCNKVFNKKYDLNNHMNRKNKCIFDKNETPTESVIVNDNELEMKKLLLENDFLKKDLLNLKNENERLKKLNTEKDLDDIKKYKDFYSSIAGDIVEIMLCKKSPITLRKGLYLNKIEYIILHGSLTRHRDLEISNDNMDVIKKRLFCLLEIINNTFFDQFMDEIKKKYTDLIPVVREFQTYLKTLDNNKKINGMYPLSYYEIINLKLDNL